MNWESAILAVLKEDEELHYGTVTAKISEQDLREITGKTPDRTVNSYLRDLVEKGKVVEGKERGTYRLRKDGENIAERSPKDAAANSENQNEEAFKTYGRFWERNKVDWDSGQLWGIHVATTKKKGPDRESLVDFSEQQGVYVLHWHGQVTYVGCTTDGTLFSRLLSHTTHPKRGPRWDTFSWFGLRRLSEEGLKETIHKMDGDELIKYLEGVLIEALLPPLNRRAGDNFGSMYRQIQFD